MASTTMELLTATNAENSWKSASGRWISSVMLREQSVDGTDCIRVALVPNGTNDGGPYFIVGPGQSITFDNLNQELQLLYRLDSSIGPAKLTLVAQYL